MQNDQPIVKKNIKNMKYESTDFCMRKGSFMYCKL